jgi:hypothetical protein
MAAPTAKKATKASGKAVSKKTATRKVPAKKAASKAAGATTADAMSAAEQIDRKIASLDDWRGERLAELRALIHAVDPQVIEEWKWMGTPVWSHDGMLVLANPHKDKVKLTFFHGAKLDDPGKLFNAGLAGGKWRAIDFHEGDAIDKPALKALLREAIAYNNTHRVPKSKGSRA